MRYGDVVFFILLFVAFPMGVYGIGPGWWSFLIALFIGWIVNMLTRNAR